MILFCRLFLGLVFLFSGFVKAVDPWGTQIKIQEYLSAFGATSWVADWLPMAGSLLLSAVEFLIGACLVVNAWPKLSRISALLFMAVMTPLTLWLAIDNPVSDCGCFGDAIVLTNWQTFWKNVLLLACSLLLFIYLKCVVGEKAGLRKSGFVIPLLSMVVIGCVQYYSLRHLPLIDFRPFKVGSDIRAGMTIPADAERPEYATELIFERNGEQQSFALDNYPDSTWHYVGTNVRLIKEGYVPPIHDFSIVTSWSHENVTDSLLDAERAFLVLSHDIKKADTRSASQINSLYQECINEGIPFYFITSSTDAAFAVWRDQTFAQYPYFQLDATTIKTMIRSNPGVMELRKGVVVGKWNARDLLSQP